MIETTKVTTSQEKANFSQKLLVKRRQALIIAKSCAYSLVQECPESFLLPAYRRTLQCGQYIYRSQKDPSKVTSQFCRGRWCVACSRIRTGIQIAKFEGVLETMEEPYFLTIGAEFSLP